MQTLHHDRTVLTALVGDDQQAIDEALALFVRTAQDWRTHVAAAAVVGDRAALAQLGHRMKSSARAIGAWGLAAACESLELSASAEARATTLRPEVHALDALDAVLGELQRASASQATRSTNDSGRENR
jgi:HPt (histidine-containing phosphotransfer) domain-containing protein